MSVVVVVDASVPPPLRLVGGTTRGILEVKLDGEWRRVCDDFWTRYEYNAVVSH